MPKTFVRAAACVGAVLLISGGARAQNLYESDWATGAIYKYTPGGTQTGFAGVGGPAGLAVNQAGDVFVASTPPGVIGSTIYEYTPLGVQSTFATGLSYAEGLALDGASNLYEADSGSGNIYKFTPGGTKSLFASGFNDPWGVAVDKSGNVYVGDESAGTITKITLSGSKSLFASGLSQPYGLAFNAAGNLFVANLGANSIIEINPGKVESTFVSGLGAGPLGLAFNNAGDLFESEYLSGGNINEFTPDGTETTFASGLDDATFLATPVPEPAALELLVAGAAAVILRRARKYRDLS